MQKQNIITEYLIYIDIRETLCTNTVALPNFFSTKKGEHSFSEQFLKERLKFIVQ